MTTLLDRFRYTEAATSRSEVFLKNMCRAWLLVGSKSGLLAAAPLVRLADAPLDTDLRADLGKSSRRERADAVSGGQFTTDRVVRVAEQCLRSGPGDIVEVGCFIGEATRRFGELARRYGRRVIAVDPWMPTADGRDSPYYAKFLENTESVRDVIDVVRTSSLSSEAQAAVRNRPLAFAYVDGLHTYYAALSDIRMVAHCKGVIAVDDVSYGLQVMLAMRRGAHILGRIALHEPPCKEGYLLPRL